MNKDDDYPFKKKEQYLHGLNIRHVSQFGNTGRAIQNVLGNRHSFDIGVVVAADKLFHIQMTAPATPQNYTWEIRDGNQNVMTTVSLTTTASDINTTLTNAVAAFNLAMAAVTPTQTFVVGSQTTGSSTGYVSFSVTTIPGWEYYVVSTGTDVSAVEVVVEATDASMTGVPVVIGSYDLLGDLFVYSTTQANLPQTFSDIASVSSSGGQYEITTTNAHSFTDLSAITISGVTGVAAPNNLNGYWIINVTSSTTFVLLGSLFIVGSVLTNAQYTVNVNGYGEIGIGVEDNNSGLWTYTRLLGTKELNFRIQKQIDVYQERNAFLTSCYFTDDYNPPRVFYYKGPFITDGAIHAINPLGQYAYGSINQETLLTAIQTNVIFTFTQQLQSGGAVLSGNWRYAIRFLTESLTATAWTDLSNPINVYTPTDVFTDIASAENLFGDNENTTTSKINEFLISGIIPGLFKYVELAGVNYLDTTQTSQIIKRDLLLGGSTQIIQHLGTETASTDLDAGQLNFQPVSIATAKNINAIDNRLIVSNITTLADKDFTNFSRSLTHKLIIKTHDGILSRYAGDLRIGEYQLPDNVYSFVGYMLNETYRYGIKFKLKGGGYTEIYWIDDIRFDDYIQAGAAFNRGNPFGDNRRVVGGSLPNMDLTNNDTSEVYNFGIQFSNINWFYIIDGVPLANIVEEIIIERVEMIPNFREVLGRGIAILGSQAPAFGIGPVQTQTVTAAIHTRNAVSILTDPFVAGPTKNMGDYFAATGLRFDNPVGTPTTLNPAYPNGSVSTLNFLTGSLYIPDWLFGESDWSFIPGDQIVNFGAPPTIDYSGLTAVGIGGNALSADAEFYNNYREVNGRCTVGFGPGAQAFFIPLNESMYVGTGSIGTFTTIANTTYSKKYAIATTFLGFPSIEESALMDMPGSPVFLSSAALVSGTIFSSDFSIRMVEIYRPKNNKFGDIANSKYIPTGHSLKFNRTALVDTDVWGGDVMSQKTWLLHKQTTEYLINQGADPATWLQSGLCGGLSFYSQNHVNSEMINRNDSGKGYKYPKISEIEWMNGIATNAFDVAYNHGYDIRNQINSDIAFDPNSIRTNDLSTRAYYSDLKPIDSVQDNYRVILPLNFHDLDLSAGEIMHHVNLNGELFTWQVRKLQRQYFNTRGQLQTTNNLSIVIGDGSVLTRDGQTISVIGTTHKWSVIRGKSQGGNDVFYWINTELKKACRIALDGTVSLADIEGMQSFFANNLRWVSTHDNPASGQGIAGVWDDRNFEALWTMRGHKNVSEWNSVIPYSVGSVVSYAPTVFSTYEQTGELYISLVNTNVGHNPQTSTTQWQLIPHTDNNYYNEYTIAFNEQKNQFTTFYTFKPTIYLKYKDVFLSPDPQAPNTIYLHNIGGYCQWYNGNNEDGHLTLVYSGDNNMVKMLHALLVGVKPAPTRIDISTQDHHTFMLTSDFDDMNGNWVCGIKNDTLTSGTGSTEDDTSKLWGQYALIDITFQQGVLQVVNSVILKFAPVTRDYRS